MKTKILLLILFFACNFSFAGDSEIKEKAKQWAGSGPVKFVENKGQLADMDGDPVPSVLFKAEAPGINTFITEQGLPYVFFEGEKEEEKEEGGDLGRETNTKWTRIDMLLKGASIKKENIIKEGASENFFQYY